MNVTLLRPPKKPVILPKLEPAAHICGPLRGTRLTDDPLTAARRAERWHYVRARRAEGYTRAVLAEALWLSSPAVRNIERSREPAPDSPHYADLVELPMPAPAIRGVVLGAENKAARREWINVQLDAGHDATVLAGALGVTPCLVKYLGRLL